MNETTPKTCAYPGCEAVVSSDPERGGFAPGYCDLPEHNALTMFQALRRGEAEAPPQTAANLGIPRGAAHD